MGDETSLLCKLLIHISLFSNWPHLNNGGECTYVYKESKQFHPKSNIFANQIYLCLNSGQQC
uniref:Uncharacterized protein n=1 Tax=Arundo donax TaxID=35708 RepID=A0A0A9A3U0_ARUDO